MGNDLRAKILRCILRLSFPTVTVCIVEMLPTTHGRDALSLQLARKLATILGAETPGVLSVRYVRRYWTVPTMVRSLCTSFLTSSMRLSRLLKGCARLACSTKTKLLVGKDVV